MEEEKRLEELEKERERLIIELARKRGLTVMLSNDPRYSDLHEDLDNNIITEGRILIGPPHLLSFTYDTLTPGHVRRMVPSSSSSIKNEELEDMSDSDDSSSSDSEDEVIEPKYEVTERMPIPSDNVQYTLDIPHYAKKGKRYDFFVLAPSQ